MDNDIAPVIKQLQDKMLKAEIMICSIRDAIIISANALESFREQLLEFEKRIIELENKKNEESEII